MKLGMKFTGVMAAAAAFSAVVWAGLSVHPVDAASGFTARREYTLAGMKLEDKTGFRAALRAFGNPTRIVNGSGAQSGGFNVGGYAGGGAAGGGAMGASMGGGGYPGMGGGGGYPGMGGGGGGAATTSTEDGLVTWVYDNPRGVVGDTVMVTFDDLNDGRVRTVRVLGTRPYPAETRSGIHLTDAFAQVLERYGYPDMTIPLDYNHTAVYYFRYNVAFGFQGNGPNLKVDSITIGIGEMPQAAPAGGAMPAMAGGMPSMGGGMAGGYPGMGGGMAGGYPGMGAMGGGGYPGMGYGGISRRRGGGGGMLPAGQSSAE